MFGIEERSEKILREILEKKKIKKAFIFGSRGKGSYRKTSDIDIAIFGEYTSSEVNMIRWDIEESKIVYLVDLVCYERIRDEKFKESILEGKRFI